MAARSVASHSSVCSPTSRTDQASASDRDLTFGLPQPGHHRYGQVGEQDSFLAGLDTPGHLAAEAILRLVGDPHPLPAGFLAELGGPAGRAGGTLLGVGVGQPADHRDFFAVDGDFGVTGEPAVGEPAGEPVGGFGGVVGGAPRMMMCLHDYMITPLQLQ